MEDGCQLRDSAKLREPRTIVKRWRNQTHERNSIEEPKNIESLIYPKHERYSELSERNSVLITYSRSKHIIEINQNALRSNSKMGQ